MTRGGCRHLSTSRTKLSQGGPGLGTKGRLLQPASLAGTPSSLTKLKVPSNTDTRLHTWSCTHTHTPTRTYTYSHVPVHVHTRCLTYAYTWNHTHTHTHTHHYMQEVLSPPRRPGPCLSPEGSQVMGCMSFMLPASMRKAQGAQPSPAQALHAPTGCPQPAGREALGS